MNFSAAARTQELVLTVNNIKGLKDQRCPAPNSTFKMLRKLNA